MHSIHPGVPPVRKTETPRNHGTRVGEAVLQGKVRMWGRRHRGGREYKRYRFEFFFVRPKAGECLSPPRVAGSFSPRPEPFSFGPRPERIPVE